MKLNYFDCVKCGLHHIYRPEECDYCKCTELKYVEVETQSVDP